MAISRTLKLTIDNTKAISKLDSLFYIYANDKGILFKFIVIDSTDIVRKVDNILKIYSAEYAKISIVAPDGNDIIYDEKLPIMDNQILFSISDELSSQLYIAGIYNVQFHIVDDLGNIMSIPPIILEVKERITINKLYSLKDNEGNILFDSDNYLLKVTK